MFKIGVEARQVNKPDFFAFRTSVKNQGFCIALVQHHDIADDGNDFHGSVHFFDRQPHFSIFSAAHELHDVIDLHALDVNRSCGALRHAEDDVVFLKFFAFPGRTAHHNRSHFGVVIFGEQLCANAFEASAEANVKILFFNGLEIIGMRVVDT